MARHDRAQGHLFRGLVTVVEEVDPQLRGWLGAHVGVGGDRHLTAVHENRRGQMGCHEAAAAWAVRSPRLDGHEATAASRPASTARVVPSLACSTTTAIAECPPPSACRTAGRKSTPGRTETVSTVGAPTSNSLRTVRFLVATTQPLIPKVVRATATVTRMIWGFVLRSAGHPTGGQCGGDEM